MERQPLLGNLMTAAQHPANSTFNRAVLTEALELELRQALRVFVRDLVIESTAEGIVLHGRAYSFYGKQLAQEVFLARARVRIRANRIKVD
jgi:hypothetical protein